MIDPDIALPAARTRLLTLVDLYACAQDEHWKAYYLKNIEAAALDIGFVFAVDLIHMGWTPRESALLAISKRVMNAA